MSKWILSTFRKFQWNQGNSSELPKLYASDLRTMAELSEFLKENESRILKDLETLVNLESPSTDKILLDRTASYIAEYGKRMLDLDPLVVENGQAGNNLIFDLPGSEVGKPVLILTHYDTVWPEGTLLKMPFNIEGNVITGPGVFDMKGGLIQGFWALKSLSQDTGIKRPVRILCTSDEEVGSEASRELIEKEASAAECVLVLEASKDGMVKTGRKGVGRYEIRVVGKAAHAGLDHKSGISAIDELSRIVLELHSLTDYNKGTTINVGVINGGTRSNVVAAEAWCEVDLRVESLEEADRIEKIIRNLKPHNDGARIVVSGGLNRPPMERNEKNVNLFLKAKTVAASMNLELKDCVVGGASDGNFCSALGAPVLDGMGMVGGNAHADGEFVYRDTIIERTTLLALFLKSL